jgi:hypothetical protein
VILLKKANNRATQIPLVGAGKDFLADQESLRNLFANHSSFAIPRLLFILVTCFY